MEGKALDGKGAPLARTIITAKPVDPLRGCEQVETTTTESGVFSFKGLCPESDYVLVPRDQFWKTETGLKVKSAPAGKGLSLPAPLVVRFTSRDGAITDSKTGFQWAADPGRPMNWEEADQFVRKLKLSVYSDWRLPTRAELRELYDRAYPGGVDPIFQFKGVCAWTSEKKDPATSWIFYFSDGKEDWVSNNFSVVQVLAVRSAKN
jgi:hypothetical protein